MDGSGREASGNRRNLCSVLTEEPLPGTAKQGRITVALEHPHGWGRDVLDGEALGPELSRAIKRHLKPRGASLQLIRKPGRAGQERTTRSLYIAHAEAGVLEHLTVSGPEDVLDLDLGGPGSNPGATRVDRPVMLVCTHARRDRCCAIFGRPAAAAMETAFPLDQVWESSHTKGHRFAPSMILLPWGYSFGTLAAPRAVEAMAAAARGELPLAGNRGRGTLDARSQVAELAVAAALEEAGEGPAPLAGLEVLPVPGEDDARSVVDPRTGRTWDVELARTPCGPVVGSCGDEPVDGTAWTAAAVRERG